MKRPNYLVDDPVVEEVRAIRRKIWEMSDGTVKGYIETLHRLAEEKSKVSSASGKNGKHNKARRSVKAKTLGGRTSRPTKNGKITRDSGRKKV